MNKLSKEIKPKILVVDDCKENLLAIKTVLKDFDIDIIFAESGKEALSYVLRDDFALILLDVQMAEMDGFETASYITSYNETKNVPIIFLTAAHKNSEDLHKGYKHGAVDYLFKPFDSQVIRGKVRVFVELYKQRSTIESLANNLEKMRINAQDILQKDNTIQGKLLIVDDVKENLIAMKATLKSLNVEMDLVLSGKEALELAKSNEYAGIILDVQMPEMDGFEVALKLKDIELAKDTPIIFVTAISKEERYIFKGYESGAIDYLLKPINAEVLKTKIKHLLKIYQQKRSLEFLYIEKNKLLSKIDSQSQQLKELSQTDILTDMPNKGLFENALKHKIYDMAKSRNAFPVVAIRIENLKKVSEAYGHKTEDLLLLEFGNRIKNIMKKDDFIARYGSHDFMIILGAKFDQQDIESFIEKVISSTNKPFVINGEKIYLSVNVGVAYYPVAGTTAEILIKNANIALRQAKSSNRKFEFYSQELNIKYERKLKIENGLRDAITNGEVSVYYQPKYNLFTKKLSGFEALLRWSSVQLKDVSPSEFIPIAEETGIIIELGNWVISKVCEDQSSFEEKFGEKIPISLNISNVQLNDSRFINNVKSILDKTKASPEYIELEFSENSIMDYINSSLESTLFALNRLGFNLAIDDFGTGYSSLSKLKKLPIHTVKVGGSYVKDLNKDENAELITRSMVSLSKGLGLNVVAERIENIGQMNRLEEYLCHEGQGFYFSEAVPKEKIDATFLKPPANAANSNVNNINKRKF